MIPEHEKKLLIKFELDKFRDYIKTKKEKIRKTKNIVEKILREEEELENMFIDEISKELDKQDKDEEIEKNKIGQKDYDKNKRI